MANVPSRRGKKRGKERRVDPWKGRPGLPFEALRAERSSGGGSLVRAVSVTERTTSPSLDFLPSLFLVRTRALKTS